MMSKRLRPPPLGANYRPLMSQPSVVKVVVDSVVTPFISRGASIPWPAMRLEKDLAVWKQRSSMIRRCFRLSKAYRALRLSPDFLLRFASWPQSSWNDGALEQCVPWNARQDQVVEPRTHRLASIPRDLERVRRLSRVGVR